MRINQNVQALIKGLLIFIVASLAVEVFDVMDSMSSGVSSLSSLAAGDLEGALSPGVGFFEIIGFLGGVAAIYGLYIYWNCLRTSGTQLDETGNKATLNIANATLLMIIAEVLFMIGIFVPIIGSVIAVILMIIAFILNIMGYSNLKKSSSLEPEGVVGAQKLFMGFVFAIIAGALGWIPLIGWIIALVFNILYWVYIFKGWKAIQISFSN